MPSIKKESFGKLADGRVATVYTLRNTKGNELKVTDYGAKVVSMRFRNKDFANKFMFKSYSEVGGFENDDAAGMVFVDGGTEFGKIFWQAEEIIEGVKFSAELDGKKIAITYSISNDNEISVIYETEGVQDISAQFIFDGEVLPDAKISAFAEGASETKISGSQTYSLIDKPAEVEMELGMFGYDPGCPIDYLDAGLKNAADIVSDAASIGVKVYATQNKLHVEEVAGGFAVKTEESNPKDGKIKSQTVYVLKNRK